MKNPAKQRDFFFTLMKKTIYILGLPLFLFSCTLNNAPGIKTPGKLDSIKIGRDTALSQKAEIFTGLYADGRFSYCDHPEINYTMSGKIHSMDSIYKIILPNAYPGQTVFAKLKGHLITTESQVVQVDSIIKLEQKNYKNDCINSDYWGTGTEPFWQLQISEKEKLIDFYNPMEQKTSHFIYSKQKTKDGIIFYTSSDKENKISITIKKEKCNGAIDPQYDYSVLVKLNGKEYNGCASKP